MYVIAKVVDHNGVPKPERIGRKVYSVEKITDTFSGLAYCYAEYADPELQGKALVTSPEMFRTIGSDTGDIVVKTLNSIYKFERIS